MENTILKALIKGRSGIDVGDRHSKRLAMFFSTEESFSKTSNDALNCILYATNDISHFSAKPFFADEMTRSKKVMFYRKADLLLKKIALAHVMTNGNSTETASSEMKNKICACPVPTYRAAWCEILTRSI
jgi:hypothetical protein